MIQSPASASELASMIEPVKITSGMSAVRALEASAIARSKPAIFWNRLIVRSTNPGRSQNVSARSHRRRRSARGALTI